MANNDEEKRARAFHRRISMTVEDVFPTPSISDVPIETELTFDIKGDQERGKKLIAEIERQLERVGFFSVTVRGVS